MKLRKWINRIIFFSSLVSKGFRFVQYPSCNSERLNRLRKYQQSSTSSADKAEPQQASDTQQTHECVLCQHSYVYVTVTQSE